MKTSHKIAFIGEPGAGKTTCIASLSEIPPIRTDVACTDELSLIKDTTTVAFDYGELDLDGSARLLLYGLPGQARFRFMFDVVRDGLLGVIVLVDAAAAGRAAAGLSETLETYSEELRDFPFVVALNKISVISEESKQQYQGLLRRHGLVAPILTVDARVRQDIARMCEVLFVMLEYGQHFAKKQGSPAWP